MNGDHHSNFFSPALHSEKYPNGHDNGKQKHVSVTLEEANARLVIAPPINSNSYLMIFACDGGEWKVSLLDAWKLSKFEHKQNLEPFSHYRYQPP